MKKIIRLLLCFVLLIVSSSCNKSNRFILSGSLSNTSVVGIDNYTLEKKIENKENFVLTIMLSTCSTCEKFKNEVLNKYISNTHATIYFIDFTELERYKNYENKPMVDVAPSIVIYNEGKIVSSLSYKYENKEFSEIEIFNEYMSNYVIEPKLVSLDEKALDEKINNNETFVLYIGWYKCGDCKLFESRILADYLLDNYNEKVIYYLESDAYRSKKPRQEPIESNYESIEEYNNDLENWNQWIDFATKYNFVSYNNGKIPTIQYYENGKMIDMLVYHNDVIVDNIVATSFFEECVGKTMNEEELLKYHDKKAIEFLNKYYKK